MKDLCVQSLQSFLEEGEVGRLLKTQSFKKGGIKVKKSNEVTIPKSRVELESKEDKESGKGKLHRTSMRLPDVRDHIAKAHKLFKEKVIAASFGRIV